MDGMLTQEEIDALTGGNNSDSSTQQASDISESLTDAERDAVGEIANINMGTAATTLSTLLNNKVTITTPRVSYVTLNELSAQYDRPCVFIHISYISGIDGNNILILKEHDVKVITDLMMGGDGTNTEGELSELHLSAISEAMNQMMGSAATSLSSMLEKKVDISPPVASLVDLNDTIEDTELSNFLDGDIVQVAFDMKIGDLVDSQIMQLYPFDFARELYKKFMGSEVEQTAAPASHQTWQLRQRSSENLYGRQQHRHHSRNSLSLYHRHRNRFQHRHRSQCSLSLYHNRCSSHSMQCLCQM